MHPRDPKNGPGQRPDGRPPFGLGPIARVATASPARGGESLPPAATQAAFAGSRSGALGAMGRRPPVGIPVGGGRPLRPFTLPNLRRNVCPHFYVTSARGAIAINAPHLLKGLVRQDRTVSRCQLRGGVHLEPGYVNDVCLSPRFNQCVFYEEELSER